jgi:hypothetical protein
MEYSDTCNDSDFWTVVATRPQREAEELFQVAGEANGNNWVFFGGVMRVVIIGLVVLFLTHSAFGQKSKSDDGDQATQLANPITKRQVLELPRRDRPPQMSLQRALKIAEAFIKKQKLDISSCYLFEAKLIAQQKTSRWAFWWVSLRGNNAAAKDIRITVTMDGRVEIE